MQRSPRIRTRNEHSKQMMALNDNPSNSTSQISINYNFTEAQFHNAVCCGVRGRALATHTDDRGFEPQCGGRLSSLTC